MNVRKRVDYSAMYAALDTLMAEELPQMKLYSGICRLVSARPEKGAAVAAAEYLQNKYPDISGFSPRNLRRMREFYQTYEADPEGLVQAMNIGWTQNTVILEAELTVQERIWYIHAVQQFKWSKLELQRQIIAKAHLKIVLDFQDKVCYTGKNHSGPERRIYDKSVFCLPDGQGQSMECAPENLVLWRFQHLWLRSPLLSRWAISRHRPLDGAAGTAGLESVQCRRKWPLHPPV